MTATADGVTIAGVGGIEPGQRRAKYHPMADIDERAVADLLDGPRPDVLLTHQGPAAVQGDHGSLTLDVVLESNGRPRFWFHGHSTPVREPTPIGETLVVPLGDVTFGKSGHRSNDPGLEGWCLLDLFADLQHALRRDPPPFWRELRRTFWKRVGWDGALVHPELARFI